MQTWSSLLLKEKGFLCFQSFIFLLNWIVIFDQFLKEILRKNLLLYSDKPDKKSQKQTFRANKVNLQWVLFSNSQITVWLKGRPLSIPRINSYSHSSFFPTDSHHVQWYFTHTLAKEQNRLQMNRIERKRKYWKCNGELLSYMAPKTVSSYTMVWKCRF